MPDMTPTSITATIGKIIIATKWYTTLCI